MQEETQRKEETASLRLTVEPVPKTAANMSLKRRLDSGWGKLRGEVLARDGHRCRVCGAGPADEGGSSRLECHEEWAYDEAARVQRLDDLITLCSRCHHVKHWQWARKSVEVVESFSIWKDEQKLAAYRESNSKVDREGNETRTPLLEDHFMAVNGCDLKAMREHVLEATEKWNRRSLLDWQTDYGEYAGHLP